MPRLVRLKVKALVEGKVCVPGDTALIPDDRRAGEMVRRGHAEYVVAFAGLDHEPQASPQAPREAQPGETEPRRAAASPRARRAAEK